MKRFLKVILSAFLILGLLAGCGGKATPAGKYVTKSIGGKPVEQALTDMLNEYGDGMSLEDYLKSFGMKSAEEFMVFELKSDGTATMSVAGMEPDTGTWKAEGNKVTLILDSQPEDPIEYTFNGKDELNFKVDEQDYVFVKK